MVRDAVKVKGRTLPKKGKCRKKRGKARVLFRRTQNKKVYKERCKNTEEYWAGVDRVRKSLILGKEGPFPKRSNKRNKKKKKKKKTKKKKKPKRVDGLGNERPVVDKEKSGEA